MCYVIAKETLSVIDVALSRTITAKAYGVDELTGRKFLSVLSAFAFVVGRTFEKLKSVRQAVSSHDRRLSDSLPRSVCGKLTLLASDLNVRLSSAHFCTALKLSEINEADNSHVSALDNSFRPTRAR